MNALVVIEIDIIGELFKQRLILITKNGQIIDITALIWYIKVNEVPARGVMLLPQKLLFYFFGYPPGILIRHPVEGVLVKFNAFGRHKTGELLRLVAWENFKNLFSAGTLFDMLEFSASDFL